MTKLVSRICDLIEIEADLDESMRAIETIKHSQKLLADDVAKYDEAHRVLFGELPWGEHVCDALLAHAVMNYGNVYSVVNGRTSLGGQVGKIYKANDRSLHQFVMDLRHKFFAHREYQANKHRLYVCNTPQGPLIEPGAQRVRIVVSMSVDISSCAQAIAITTQYVIAERKKSCEHLERQLNAAQKEVIANGRLGDKYFEYESPNRWLPRGSSM